MAGLLWFKMGSLKPYQHDVWRARSRFKGIGASDCDLGGDRVSTSIGGCVEVALLGRRNRICTYSLWRGCITFRSDYRLKVAGASEGAESSGREKPLAAAIPRQKYACGELLPARRESPPSQEAKAGATQCNAS